MNRVVVSLLLCLLFPLSSFAQTFWLQTAGPGVGSVTAFGKGNGVILAAAGEGGIFYSTNNGTDWKPSSQTVEYAAQDVFATNSKGWIYTINSDEVLVSKNNGKDWSATAGSPSDAGAFATLRNITIDNNDILYIGTDNSDSKGIWISNDDGDSWGPVATGLPKLPALGGYYVINGMATAPDGALYICSGGGVHKLASGASTWTLCGFGGQVDIPGNLDTNVTAIAVSSTGRIFAAVSTIGLCASSDKGKTWVRLANKNGLNTTNGVGIATDNNGGIIYSAGPDGVYISANNGVDWKLVRQPSDDPAQAVAFTSSGAFVGYKSSGVAFSADKGQTWTPHSKGLFTSHINAMCADSKGHVFASVQNSSIYSTTDAGDVWSSISEALAGKDIRGLTTTSSNAMFAATYMTSDDPGGLLKSVDGGNSWTNLSDQVKLRGNYINRFTSVLTTAGGKIFVGGANGVVYISTDDGTSWLNSGKPVRSGITTDSITAMVSTNQEQVFAANAYGIFRSNAISDTTKWDTLITSPKNVTALLIDESSNPTILYAAAVDGIYTSNDNGTTWIKNSSVSNATGVAINSKGIVYTIGTNGTFSSNDKGATWKHESDELNSLSPTLLFVDHKDVLYAGTAANGVYRNPLFPTEGVLAPSGHTPTSISFENNYPNPFFTSTMIQYSLVKPSSVTLEVFDMTGRYITTLVSEFQLDGQHRVAFDAAGFSIPGGVYNCRLSANAESVMSSVVYMGK
ncbi:MAG TPA: T9SS type A sorting domain-containing protein [Candidatus Kapabacteria bacterium]|nr:T9SS type A sorting domain-containing protein [Candidatus Kapabacteria bacterium]